MTDTKYTYCHTCEVSCGLKVTARNNRITKIEPDRDHVASQGYACPKGIHFDAVQYSPDRVLHPRKRQMDKWEDISWDQTLSEIGAKVRHLMDRHGPDSIAFYGGSGPGYNFTGSLMWNALIDGIGTKNIYAAGSQDCINKMLVYQHMYGSSFRIGYPDLENTRMMIFVGANPAISKMTLTQVPRTAQRLRSIVGRGGRVVFIDPRRTESVKVAGEHHFIRPDTDVYFLMAFLNELIHTGGVDQSYVSQYMRGFQILEEVCTPWTPERAEGVTGIPADSIRELVAAHREAKGAAFYCSTGVNMGTNGTLAFWIAEAINAVSGNIDRPGGILFGQGLFDMAKTLKKSGRLERTDRTRVSGLPSVIDTFPGAVMAEEILTPGKGQIKALFIYGGNPLLTCANPNGRLEEAFRSLELLVSIDLFQNESGDLAHYILPSTTYMERSDLPMVMHWMAGDQPKRYVQYAQRVLTPPEDVREELWIFSKLALASRVPLYGAKPVYHLFKALDLVERLPVIGPRVAFSSDQLIGLTLRMASGAAPRKKQIRDHPHGQLLEQNRPGTFLGKRVLTNDGRVDLAPESFVSATPKLEDDYKRLLGEQGSLKLITKREPFTHNSWTHNFKPFVGPKRTTNYLYLNPGDAKKRRLKDGDGAEISSAFGQVEIPVRITEDLMPGVVAFPHGWGHQNAQGLSIAREHPGVNANLLTPDGPEGCEALSGMAHMTGLVVEVRKAKPRKRARNMP